MLRGSGEDAEQHDARVEGGYRAAMGALERTR